MSFKDKIDRIFHKKKTDEELINELDKFFNANQ